MIFLMSIPRMMLASVAVTVLIISVIMFQVELSNLATNEDLIYDKSILSVISAISDSVPANETLVVSTSEPHFIYFNDRSAAVPWSASSEQTLVSLMKENGNHSLAIIENVSAAPELDQLFSTVGLGSLDTHFEQLRTDESDFFRVHLYKLRSSD
jgi:hypothetical protein